VKKLGVWVSLTLHLGVGGAAAALHRADRPLREAPPLFLFAEPAPEADDLDWSTEPAPCPEPPPEAAPTAEPLPPEPEEALVLSAPLLAYPEQPIPLPSRPLPLRIPLSRPSTVAPAPPPALPAPPVSPPTHQAPQARTAARRIAGESRPPVYPEEARRRGQEGRVLLRLRIDESGRVRSAEIVESSGHEALDRAAVGAVREWRFLPATVGGVPRPSALRVPVRFSLSDRR
jgi:protein TonB